MITEKQLREKFSDLLIDVTKIVTVYYNDFTKDYVFEGEKHNFWELVYVDHGEIEVTADNRTFLLKKDDVIFHQPNEFHTLSGNNILSSSVLVISFVCESESMAFFEKQIVNIGSFSGLRDLLRQFVIETQGTFGKNFGRIYLSENRLSQPVFGSEQMMYMYLTQFLIQLIRNTSAINQPEELLIKRHFTNQTIREITEYMEINIAQPINLDILCKEFYLSKTYLKKIFKKHTGYSVINYLTLLRLSYAKRLIREEKYTMAQISKMVGYPNQAYFSTIFKKNEGLSPKKYLETIKIHENELK